MRDYSGFDKIIDEYANQDIQWEDLGNGKRKGTLKSFVSDDSNLADAAEWLEREASAGNLMPIRKEKTNEGMRLLVSHPRRNALFSVELDANGKYKKVKML